MIRKRYLPPSLVSLMIVYSLLFTFILPYQALNAQKPEYPVTTIDGKKYYEYTVQPREGFFRLRVNFDISQEDVIKHNPQAKDGLQAGMKILIPVKGEESDTAGQFIEHVVEKKQTMFRIRKMYSVSEDEILEYNPQIRGRSLRVGDVLRIPVKTDSNLQEKEKKESTTAVKATNEKAKKQAEESNSVKVSNILRARKQHFKIAFLLPFNLEQKHESSDSRFVEFYAGSLLAIQQAKQRGKHIEVFTFDTQKSDLHLMEVLRDSILTEVDLIVGPAYADQVAMVCDFARIHKVKTIIPFTSKIHDLESNEYIFQFNPGPDTELQKLTEILSTETQTTNLVFIENPYASVSDDSNQLVAQLKLLLRNKGTDFQSLIIDPQNTSSLRNAIQPSKENLFIFNTSRINTISSQLRQLKSLADSFAVKIYEPYAWRSSKTEKPSSFYLSIFRNEYPDTAYEEYMQLFGEVFNWLPVTDQPRYDLLGYDLMNYYFGSANLPREARNINYPPHDGIQSTILFEKASPRGGYINKQLNHYE